MFFTLPPKQRRTDGFSMTELAIVLGVVGIILSGLWAAVATAWEHTRREQVREAMATTIANARNYFAGQAGVSSLGYVALTKNLLAVNVIPNYLQRNGGCSGNACADHPWGNADLNGTFRVCNWPLGATASDCSAATAVSPASAFIGISLTGLYTKQCIALVESISSASEPTGLVEISINGYNLLANGKTIQPVSDADVVAQCSKKTDNTNTAAFVYRIVSPAP